MKLLASDPGSEESAMIVFDTEARVPLAAMFLPNEKIRAFLRTADGDYGTLVIEYTPPYTMRTNKGGSFVPSQVVDTAIELGTFKEAYHPGKCELVSRLDVKKHLLGRSNGDDAMVAAALFERYGGKVRAKGGVKCDKCKGKGTHGFEYADCPECCATGVVMGARGLKNCPACKCSMRKKLGPAKCDACNGSTWKIPPGPLADFKSHLYAALAVAVTYCETSPSAPAKA